MRTEPHAEAGVIEAFRTGIELDDTTYEHHSTGEHSREAHSHFVQDNTRNDEEEHIDVEEHFSTLHTAKSITFPTACGLHKILDGREDVHENVRTEHGQRQQQQGCPAYTRLVS